MTATNFYDDDDRPMGFSSGEVFSSRARQEDHGQEVQHGHQVPQVVRPPEGPLQVTQQDVDHPNEKQHVFTCDQFAFEIVLNLVIRSSIHIHIDITSITH